MIREEIGKIKGGNRELRQFGISLGIVLAFWGFLFLWRGRHWYPYCFIASALFFFFALVLPKVLTPAHKILTALVIITFQIITMVTLCILFYLIMTPMGILSRVFGKDFLDLRINRNRDSYWIPREDVDINKEHYERQF